MQSDLDVQPSYFGFVETRDDALMLIQACVRGSLHFAQRRPTLSERPSVAQSGHVFIYEEKASGIQRWSDGRHWSPSRVLGEFLIYGEKLTAPHESHAVGSDNEPRPEEDGAEGWHRRLYGPLARSFHFQPQSLVKKTIKVKDTAHFGTRWHLISYYRPVDVLRGQLQTPTTDQDLVLQPWHLPRNLMPHGNSLAGDQAGGSSLSPATHQWDRSPSTEHRVQSNRSTLRDYERGHTNVDPNPIPNLEILDNGAMPWSIDGLFGPPSPFGCDTHSAEHSAVWNCLNPDLYDQARYDMWEPEEIHRQTSD